MSNNLLQQLEDTKKRKFPVIYKYVKEVIGDTDKDEIDFDSVYINSKKDAKSKCLDYHKPISKLI